MTETVENREREMQRFTPRYREIDGTSIGKRARGRDRDTVVIIHRYSER